MRPVQRKRIYEHVRLLMAAIMCCGLLKILCIMCVCVCMCLLHLCQWPHSHQVWSSQGFPITLQTTVSHLPVFQCLWHAAAASDGDPVTDSQMTLFFQSPFINTAPRAFLTTNQCVSERGRDQSVREAHALYNCMTTCYRKLRTL